MIEDRKGLIRENIYLGLNYYLLTLELSTPLGNPEPGQFVMIRLFSSETFLRRPFSIYDTYENELKILYRVSGKGTTVMSTMQKGERIDVLGPLGRGFTSKQGRIALVAGGIGIAGLHLLAKKKKDSILFFGCNKKEELCLLGDIKVETYVSTMDGSFGFRGNVVSLLASKLDFIKKEGVPLCACGPEEMLKSLKSLVLKENIPCEALVEQRMACGMGLCFGCVIETYDEREPFKRVCKEGPVFDLWQIFP